MKGRVFHNLNGLRGVAAIIVVIFHLPAVIVHSVVPEGYLAVDLFFVLSGFVLAHSWGERLRSGGAIEFLIQRFLRLWPLYMLGTLIGLALVVVQMIHGDGGFASWKRIAVSLVLGAAFVPTLGRMSADVWHQFPFVSPAWSLFWELAINVCLALVGRRLSNKVLTALIVLGVALMVVTALFYGSLDAGSSWSTFWGGGGRVVYSFFIGVACYRVWERGWLATVKLPAWLTVLLVIAIFAVRPGDYRQAYDLAVTLIAFPALILASTSDNAASNRINEMLGATSYGVYVLHSPMIHWLQMLSPRLLGIDLSAWTWAPTIVLLAALLAVALLLDRFFDVRARMALTRLYRAFQRSRSKLVAAATI